ncbi:hypothetical protein NIES593_11515 [Hydrococcus rivularis NIES-593]|uniref:Uncharacterized protein n=1 Tax=Hydrococcus rivularis NIES-593 TaxID=1921803 RepID=A0A1U7HGS1_9CYAN|nr:hypothetical protein [Hydrococcus rivularis]OKH22751.1 hypothetical protein NIES593_11515 [Hydrococcus rivularis NIES-593]
MKHYCDGWIQEWCDNNGWTDLFMERRDFYWAFPPGAVIPEPIPTKTLRAIKAEKGLCPEEKVWIISATVLALVAAALSYILRCPMPIVFAFAFAAITVAQLEVEEI